MITHRLLRQFSQLQLIQRRLQYRSSYIKSIRMYVPTQCKALVERLLWICSIKNKANLTNLHLGTVKVWVSDPLVMPTTAPELNRTPGRPIALGIHQCFTRGEKPAKTIPLQR
jgi:hypothetical protein